MFNSITFSGSDYSIDGHPITLNAYLSNSSPALTTNTFNCALDLGGSQTVTVAQDTTLNLNGVIGGSTGIMGKEGPGTLALGGTAANTYTGSTAVRDGTLALNKSAGNNAAAGALIIGDGVGTDRVLLLSSNQISDSAAITINTSGVLALNGHDETIGPLTMSGAALVDSGGGTLTLNGDVTRPVEPGTPFSTIAGRLSLGGTNRAFIINTNFGLTAMEISAVISDGSATAGLTKSGAGPLVLSGSNTYSGPSVIAAGILTVSNATGLGAIDGGTTVSNGATLGLAGGILVNESVVALAGKLESFTGTNQLTGTILLGASDSTVRVDSGKLKLFSAVAGVGGVLKDGAGDLEFAGLPNTYSGTTTVSAGTLLLNKAPGSIAIPGPLIISGTVRSLTNEQITNNAPVAINSSGLLDLNGFTETIGSLAGPNGASVALSNGSLIAGGNDDSTAFAGAISGSGASLTKLGFGTMTLAGNNSYSGATFASQGTLLINGVQPFSPISLNGGTLGGTGTVATILVSSGSTVSPGASPGILNSSNFTFSSGIATFSIELNGTTPGTGYDQLNVTGTVALNGLTLNVSLGFTPALGDSFTIINNDGSDQIIGTFGGLPEGKFFSVGGASFRITYSGGPGSNDVVLTRDDVPPTNAPQHRPGPGQRQWPVLFHRHQRPLLQSAFLSRSITIINSCLPPVFTKPPEFSYLASTKTINQELLDEVTGRLAAEFQPEQVWLFGSHAWGQPDEGSDIDLLVVVPKSDEPPVRRAQRAHRCLRGVGASMDILVKTRAELERFRHVRSSLESLVLRNGRLIYG
jgi:autotransporter-associated beta strand protein